MSSFSKIILNQCNCLGGPVLCHVFSEAIFFVQHCFYLLFYFWNYFILLKIVGSLIT